MAQPLRPASGKDPLPKEMQELYDEVEALPASSRKKLLPLCDRVGHLLRLQGRLIRVAQDSVDQLQMDTKYLVFDLEATRRERDAFAQELDNLNGGQELY
jgi:hypothetical protein